MHDYERIADVIRYLDQHHVQQPGLATLAQRAGLSRYHFHRLFSSWAGVTPKDFLQSLTLEQVKASLRNGASVLDAALDAGLSGAGRIHDLCVTLQAASPGEIKSGGAGWTITAGFSETPFGRGLIAESPRGICHLSFVDTGHEQQAWREMKDEWPNAQWQRNDNAAAKLITSIFNASSRSGQELTLRTVVRGTPFQLSVWRALLRIPEGHVISYKSLAAHAGEPAAIRAVGTAVGRNPIAYLIPCHRVIRETGVLGQYRWGSTRKRVIIAWENARRASL